ncbi:MAG: hypothetical protein AAGD14_04555 [Planctomycetota bacterium]
MSLDFLLLVGAGLACALGFWAALHKTPRHPAAWIAAVLYLLAGVHTAVFVSLVGIGEILPGYQLNPAVQAYWSKLMDDGLTWVPAKGFALAALVAHVLTAVARGDRRLVPVLWPVTVFFVSFYFVGARDQAISFARARAADATAYVSVLAEKEGARMVFAIGAEDDLFLPIVHRHEADGPPPQPELRFSRDGAVFTFTTRGAKPYFALDRDGNATGWLPTRADRWAERSPSPADSVDFRRILSAAQVAVAKLLAQHGGPARN